MYHLKVPGSSEGKEPAYNAGDLGSILGLGRSSGEGKGYPLQYSGLENSMDYIIHGVVKSQILLNDYAHTSHPKLFINYEREDRSFTANTPADTT